MIEQIIDKKKIEIPFDIIGKFHVNTDIVYFANTKTVLFYSNQLTRANVCVQQTLTIHINDDAIV